MFARLRKRMSAKLLMIGDGPDTAGAFALAQSLGIADDLKFLGNREDVDQILCATDAFLLPSNYEAFGLAALEAMACGVPVVASRVGGVPELVQDGINGFLVAPDDYDAGADKLFQILSDGETATRLRNAGLKSVRDNFTADAVVPLYEQFYESVLT